MAAQCLKCQTENPDTKQFYGDCGTQLLSITDIEVKGTIDAPGEELTRGITFADRYKIIEKLGTGEMGAL